MKQVVVVAYFFPPTGGAGVQRIVKFVRYLPERGWRTTVVTVRESRYWMRDPSLLREIPEDVAVVRTPARTAPELLASIIRGKAGEQTNARRSGSMQRSLRRLAGFFLLPDPYVGWVSTAERASRRALADGGVLLTTSSPDSAHLVGLRLARRGVPWVADFRDPWVRRMSFAPPTLVHRRIQESLERQVVNTADRIIVTSDATREDFLARYPRLEPKRVVCIPNGYDEEDFPKESPPPDPSFLIVHAGQLNPERPISRFLDHLEAFFSLRPAARGECRVELIGPRYREDEEAVSRRGLGDAVQFRDALPHREAIGRLLAARVLLLMEQESARGSLILPGKLFEYLRARRPILGLLPRGAAWDLIEKLRAGQCTLPSDPGSGGGILANLFDAAKSGPQEGAGDLPATVRSFDRRALAGRLSDLLDEVLREREGPSPRTEAPSVRS